MKTNIISLMAIFALMVGGFRAQASARNVVADVQSFEYIDDSVCLDLKIDLSGLDLSSNESLVLTPIISKGENQMTLQTIVLRGRNSAQSYQRSQNLGNSSKIAEYDKLYGEPYALIDYYGSDLDDVIIYKQTIPYKTWLVDSKVYLSSTRYSCCNSYDMGFMTMNGDSQLSIAMLEVEPYNVAPQVAMVKPDKVAVKRRDIQYSSALIFRVNSSYIDPNLENNRAELQSIRSMMESVLHDSDYTITAVNIAGFASPEGSLSSNQILSERRATALENILKKEYSLSSSLYNVRFGGENWDGLIPLVEASYMANKELVLAIIKYDDEDQREPNIRKIDNGVTYSNLLANYFPAVRRVVVDIEYNVDAYDLDRIKELIDIKPENLSLEEMYRLSETYDMQSSEFTKVFLTAARVYPYDQVAIHNALVVDISTGDLESARELVERLDHQTSLATVANTLGAYYMLEGDYTQSKTLLERARELGSPEAEYNLAELEAKLANIVKINEALALRNKIYGQ